MQHNSLAESWFINDFHRKNSMAAQREVQQMSLHPCSREQNGTDSQDQGTLSDYQRACELGTQQEAVIEQWAKAVGLWTPWSPHLTNGLRRTWRT